MPEDNADSTRDPIDELIDQWFADHFHGSAVARNTDVYAEVFHAKERLKQLLAERGLK